MKIEKGDLVVVRLPGWGIDCKEGKVINVLEGAENKYVVDIGEEYNYLVWEHEVRKL
ncbi:hypothetical protein [Enterococcus faecium]|uniref:hypothetical protein n=1 Tax=Enterococcus faecium TaxID=1352 RepID=UPI0015E2FFA2|nr:hypothetical protein [Enterococcus faecium]